MTVIKYNIVIQNLYGILLFPFKALTFPWWRREFYSQRIAIWYGTTQGLIISILSVYGGKVLLRHLGIEISDIIICILIIWGGYLGAYMGVFFFPDDGFSGTMLPLSVIAVIVSSNSVFLICILLAILKTSILILCVAVGSALLSFLFIGVTMGYALRRLIFSLVGIFDYRLLNTSNFNFIDNKIFQSLPQQFSISLTKIMIFTLPCLIIAIPIGDTLPKPLVAFPFVLCIGWIIWITREKKYLIIDYEGIRIENRKSRIARWNDILICSISSDTYALVITSKDNNSGSYQQIIWPWLFMSIECQIKLIIILRHYLSIEKLLLKPGPVPSRELAENFLKTAEHDKEGKYVGFQPANINTALEIAKLLCESDLIIRALVLNSKISISRGSVASAEKYAEQAVIESLKLDDFELQAYACINRAQISLSISPHLGHVKKLIQDLESYKSKCSLDLRNDIESLKLTYELLNSSSRINLLNKININNIKNQNLSRKLVATYAEVLISLAEDEPNKTEKYKFYLIASKLYQRIEDLINEYLTPVEKVSYGWCKFCLGQNSKGTSIVYLALKNEQKKMDPNLSVLLEAQWRLGLMAWIKNDLEEAYEKLTIASDLVESMRYSAQNDWQRIAILSGRRQRIYEDIIKLCLCIPPYIAQALRMNATEKAFDYAERSKSRALLDLTGFHRFEKQLNVKQLRNIDSKEYSIGSKSDNMNFLDETMIKSVITVRAVDVNDVRKRIGNSTLIIEYCKVREQWLMFLITKHDLKVIKLPNYNKQGVSIESLVDSFFNEISNFKLIGNQNARNIDKIMEIGYELYNITWKPAKEIINKASFIYIVPHNLLYKLPFYALYDGHDWLVKYCPPLSFIPNANILNIIKYKNLPEKPQFLGLANPNAYINLPRIPNTVKEVWQAAEKYLNCTVLPSKDQPGLFPSRSDFFALAPKADVIHLACHGDIDENSPLSSRFWLHNPKGGADAITAYDILTCSPLKARLFIASICYGSSGVLASGSEWLGLLRSFIASGVQNILAARWSLSDTAACYVMQQFHTELQEKSIAHAIRDVNASLIATTEFNHPFFWSSMSVWGDGGFIKKL